MHLDDTINKDTVRAETLIFYNKNKGGTNAFDKLYSSQVSQRQIKCG